MKKQAGGRAARKMKPVILVLCEGKTEECYVDCLKQKYRLPIQVISKVVGQKISPALINRYKNEMRLCKSEQIDCFLLYDADVPEIADRIAACTGATAILSRPCLEVWFLAHTEKVAAADLSAAECLRRLTRTEEWKGYRKGFLSESEKKLLWDKRLEAMRNIAESSATGAAFSNIPEFIRALEHYRQENKNGDR